jgi:hypothetical protein
VFEFPAAFDSSAVDRMERNAQENTTQTAIYRRLELALMTRARLNCGRRSRRASRQPRCFCPSRRG